MDKTISDIDETKAIISNLSKNTEVLEAQFEQYGFKVSAFGYNIRHHVVQRDINLNKYIDYNYCLEAFVEVISAGNMKPEGDFNIRLNLYNEDGNIIASEASNLDCSKFTGLFMGEFLFKNDGIALMAQKARIFIEYYH